MLLISTLFFATRTLGQDTSAEAIPVNAPPIDFSQSQVPINNCVNANDWAITLDDGPSKNIPAVLQILRDKAAVATFFVNGRNFADLVGNQQDKDNLASVFAAGHQIATHTFEHPDLTTLSVQAIYDQMRSNDIAIRNIIGVRPIHFRLPFLSTNDVVNAAIGTWGYRTVGVNVDTKDYQFSSLALADAVAGNQQSYLAALSLNPSSVISLNHDFTTQITAWLPAMIDDIRARGFNLVNIQTCLGDPAAYRP